MYVAEKDVERDKSWSVEAVSVTRTCLDQIQSS